jgi:hypothetical protein
MDNYNIHTPSLNEKEKEYFENEVFLITFVDKKGGFHG